MLYGAMLCMIVQCMVFSERPEQHNGCKVAGGGGGGGGEKKEKCQQTIWGGTESNDEMSTDLLEAHKASGKVGKVEEVQEVWTVQARNAQAWFELLAYNAHEAIVPAIQEPFQACLEPCQGAQSWLGNRTLLQQVTS